jgi:hypothetical protein
MEVPLARGGNRCGGASGRNVARRQQCVEKAAKDRPTLGKAVAIA